MIKNGMIGYVLGMKLVEVPDFATVRRSWWERWFTLPWSPRTKTRLEPTHWPKTLGNSVIVSKETNTIYARAHIARELRRLEACEAHP